MSEPDPVTDTVTVPGSSTVTDDVAVIVEEPRPGERRPCTITTTVTHPETGVVKSESTAIVHDPDDVPRVAVNEVGDAVLKAANPRGPGGRRRVRGRSSGCEPDVGQSLSGRFAGFLDARRW
ncbi:hypothetical protein Sfulv_37620 [Streptomyces fulvorobeus]|uniref:Uncharacterized protein n=1 Tax=Streptomyces fulvorobeus TaxID=284028 RepID=A0A7J0C905_9ACTN|nr:hypothetical protein Sfulv_37620 [Streptomyces fulvorobeus]